MAQFLGLNDETHSRTRRGHIVVNHPRLQPSENRIGLESFRCSLGILGFAVGFCLSTTSYAPENVLLSSFTCLHVVLDVFYSFFCENTRDGALKMKNVSSVFVHTMKVSKNQTTLDSLSKNHLRFKKKTYSNILVLYRRNHTGLEHEGVLT